MRFPMPHHYNMAIPGCKPKACYFLHNFWISIWKKRKIPGKLFRFSDPCGMIFHRWYSALSFPEGSCEYTADTQKGGFPMVVSVRSLGLNGISGYAVSAWDSPPAPMTGCCALPAPLRIWRGRSTFPPCILRKRCSTATRIF